MSVQKIDPARYRQLEQAIINYLAANGPSRQIDIITDLKIQAAYFRQLADMLISNGVVARDKNAKLMLGDRLAAMAMTSRGQWLRAQNPNPQPVLYSRWH